MASWHALSFILIPLATLYITPVCYAGALVLQAVDPGRRQEMLEQTQVCSKDRTRNQASVYDIISKATEMSEPHPHTERPALCLQGPWQTSYTTQAMPVLSESVLLPS